MVDQAKEEVDLRVKQDNWRRARMMLQAVPLSRANATKADRHLAAKIDAFIADIEKNELHR